MTIDDLTQTTGEWLRGVGNMSDVVISSRIRLARNLAEYPFLSTARSTERTEIYRRVENAVAATPAGRDALFVDVDEADSVERQILVERHLVSQQLADAEGCRGVTISPDETNALMINEEDHLRIQAMRSGLELDHVWRDISEVDDTLAERVEFAYDRRFGFLTACPTNVGTGIRVSVMLHLPALKLTKEIERVARAARDMRLAVRGMHGEGTDAVGDLYQLSNQTTLGKTEHEIIQAFSDKIVPKIVEYERTARKSLAQHSPYQLDDKLWRAFGILSHARRITSDETQTLLSPLRMGIHMKRFDQFDIATLNELFLYTQPGHLQKLHGQTLSDEERDAVRADYLRKRLSNLN